MSMFGALVPNQETAFGTESYEEVVDNFCTALEDVEAEISGLEALNDSIDNAEAFAAAIESCGATPALLQFGYACDDSFEQLIGRAAPADFATEDMDEFGAFALESIRSKLVLAWEAVKTFLSRLWEKLKEFGRWILSLFDRKEAKLRAIAKAAKEKELKGKPFAAGKGDKRHVRCYEKRKIEELVSTYNLFQHCKSVIDEIKTAVRNFVSGNNEANKGLKEKFNQKLGAIFGNTFKAVFQANSRTGAVELASSMKEAFKERSLQEAGFTRWSDIYNTAELCIKGLNNKKALDAAVKDFGDILREVDSGIKEAEKRNLDAEGERADKLDREETARKDYARADAYTLYRIGGVAASKTVVLVGKIINNCAASVIAVANCAGL